jgi:hypothetical protein
MAVTIECTVKVPIRQLRAALTAVVPHAEPTKTRDEVSPLSRVRLLLGKSELLVMAMSERTVALAACEIVEDTRGERFAADDGVFAVDVEPGIVRSVLQAYKAPKVGVGADDPLAAITVEEGPYWRIEDEDGLIPGLATTYPRIPLTDRLPDIPRHLGDALRQASASPGVRPLVTDDPVLRLFAKASAAYSRTVTAEPIGGEGRRGWLVWCGPSFIGLLASDSGGEDTLGGRQRARHVHMVRLGLADADEDILTLARAALGDLPDGGGDEAGEDD